MHHMQGTLFLGLGAGLPLFLLLMFGLASSGSSRETICSFAPRKTRFLFEPWVRWPIIYIVLLGLADAVRSESVFQRLEWNMVLYGGQLSLWFLPFVSPPP